MLNKDNIFVQNSHIYHAITLDFESVIRLICSQFNVSWHLYWLRVFNWFYWRTSGNITQEWNCLFLKNRSDPSVFIVISFEVTLLFKFFYKVMSRANVVGFQKGC